MNPEFNLERYFSTPAQIDEYNRHIKNKALSNVFMCNLEDLSDFSARHIFESFALTHLAEIQEPIFPNLVRVFYTNMKYPTNTEGAFKTTVFDNTFLVSPTIINRLLRTSRTNSICACAHRQFKEIETISEAEIMAFVTRDSLVPISSPTVHVLKKVNLSLDIQVLAELVQCVLLPRKGHLDTLTLLDVWVMGCLGLGIPLDIGYLVCRYMNIARCHAQQSLPFASLITLLLYRTHVEISEDEPVITFSSRQRITLSTFQAKHWEKVDGIWRIKTRSSSGTASSSKRARMVEETDSDNDDAEHAAPAAGTASSSRLSAEERHDTIIARLDSLSTTFTTKLDSITTSLTGLSTSLTRLQTDTEARFTDTEARLTRLEEKIDLFTGFTGDS